MDTTGRALVDHWVWAIEKGLMNLNTAGALRAACMNVLPMLDDWESVDVRDLDVEDTLTRFRNLRAQKYKPASLEAYQRRFRQAVARFLEYVDDPGGWKPTARLRVSSAKNGNSNGRTRRKAVQSVEPAVARDAVGDLPGTGLHEYEYPLRDGVMARLVIPRDVTMVEMRRLLAWARTLAVDYEAE